MSGAVERAVRRDLRRLPREERASALAAAALGLARMLDGDAEVDAKWLGAAAQAARELRATMGELLRDAVPESKDEIDELLARRDARRGAAG